MTAGCGETLRFLNISEMDELADLGLTNIAENCPNLISIKLENCYYITDAGLKALSNCTLLEEIDIEGNDLMVTFWDAHLP